MQTRYVNNMGRRLTLRGVVSQTRRERIFRFDSNVMLKGWKIIDFRISQNDLAIGYTVSAVLHTHDENVTTSDWDRNTVVGLADISKENNFNSLLDYDHVLVRDLFLTNLTSNQPVNYLLLIEEIEITPSENIVYQIKEMAQDSSGTS